MSFVPGFLQSTDGAVPKPALGPIKDYYVVFVTGFLQSTDGAVLKPALGHTKGEREVRFYQRMFSEDCRDQVLLDLRHFVPKFLGIWTAPEHPGCELYASR